ncbi:MAG: GIY-YIG nuclease family protein [Candidatus Brocadiaceae bacterium]|nr:GIY-YIG nuclease family protein [Candidatus Brocadiaceae bacterium]
MPACLARRKRRRQAPTLHHNGPTKGFKIEVGKLGRASFPKGFYVYAGSAQKNLSQRLARHFRNAKSRGTLQRAPTNKTPGSARWEWPSPPHWHIDYLLPHAKILSIHVFKASKEWECRLSQKIAGLEGARIIMKGFGASDCKCPSHLYYFSLRPRISRGVLQYAPTRS